MFLYVKINFRKTKKRIIPLTVASSNIKYPGINLMKAV